MTILINYIGIKHFLIIMLLFICLFIYIIILKWIQYPKLPLEKYEENPELLILYVDKYYIKNKYVTFSSVILYFLIKIIMIFYLRYLYLGYEILIKQFYIENILFPSLLFFKMGLIFLILFIIIKLFYFLLHKIFFTEIMKIYIYYYDNEINQVLVKYLVMYSIRDIWGSFCLFFECIYRKTPVPEDSFYNEYYCYDYIYKNQYVIKATIFFIDLTTKYKLLFWLILLCRKYANVLYIHYHQKNINQFLPILLLTITIIYDFFSRNIYYTYYMLFICYFLFLFNSLYNFIINHNPIVIYNLHEFFYKNSLDYTMQRKLFFKKENVVPLKSQENSSFLITLRNPSHLEYIYNNFEDKTKPNTKMRIMYFRVYLIIIYALLFSYLIYNILYENIATNHSTTTMISFLIITWLIYVFYGKYTYTLTKENCNDDDSFVYIYTKKYEVIFWLLTILYAYIFWRIIIKPEFVFMNTGILFELPFDLLKITKIYTIDEKIYYLHQYFEYILKITNFTDQEYLRHILRQIDFRTLFIDNDDITLKDIQVYAHLFLDNYNALQIFQQICDMNYLDNLQKELNETGIKTSDFNLLDETLRAIAIRALLYYITKS